MHQWVKNLFVLAPLLFGKKFGDPWAIGQALLASASFCLMSSSLYLVNDVIDAAADRTHPEKQHRPIASGALPARVALLGASALLFVSFWVAATLGWQFLSLAGVYCGLTIGYCLAFKRVVVLDGMIIAAGFVLRVIGGAVAIGVMPTHWLIVCAFLLALYLAFDKRRQELLILSDIAMQHRQVLGQYTVGYLERVNNVLISATIVCYALYTVAPETVARFGTDRLIYGTVFVIYGLLRYMALVQNAAKRDNPSEWLYKDKSMLGAILGWTIYNALIIYFEAIIALGRGLH
jgi:4-hydroxybenzoate polyprenyltransferase